MKKNDIAQSPVEFSKLWFRLLFSENIVNLLNEELSLANELITGSVNLCNESFEAGSQDAMRELHWILHEAYKYHLLVPLNITVLHNIGHPLMYQVFRAIEMAWGKYEERRARAILDLNLNTYDGDLKAQIVKLVASHKASQHPLFDQFASKAGRSRFISFFAFDYSLNMRFFDLIALALPGLTGTAKQEVTKNLWDENGCGNLPDSHTVMYERIISKLLPTFNTETIIKRSGFEAFAGSNLFHNLSIRRPNFYRYLGCLAATEMLDPPQYEKLLFGAKRIGLDKEVDLTYYSEHASIDIVHASGWLGNVMIPLASDSKEIVTEMLLGVLMRLNTCSDYYDMLMEKLDP